MELELTGFNAPVLGDGIGGLEVFGIVEVFVVDADHTRIAGSLKGDAGRRLALSSMVAPWSTGGRLKTDVRWIYTSRNPKRPATLVGSVTGWSLEQG